MRSVPAIGAGVRDLLSKQHEDDPLGGWAGESAAPNPQIHAPPVVRAPMIPAPDWEAERREREQREKAAVARRRGAN